MSKRVWQVGGEKSAFAAFGSNTNICRKTGLIVSLRNKEPSKFQFVQCALNSNGRKMVTVDQRGNVYQFNLKHFTCQLVAKCGACGTAIAYSQNKMDDIIVALKVKVMILESKSHECIASLRTDHKESITHVEYNDSFMLTVSHDQITVWDVNNKFQQLQCLAHNHLQYAFHNTKLQEIVTCFNDSITFWSSKSFQESLVLQYNNEQELSKHIHHKHMKLSCAHINPNCSFLVTAGRGAIAYVWVLQPSVVLDKSSKSSIERPFLWKAIQLPTAMRRVIQVQFLAEPYPNTVLILGNDGTILACDVQTLEIAFTLSKPQQIIASFRCDHKNKKLVLILNDGSIDIYSIPFLLGDSSPSAPVTESEEKEPLNAIALGQGEALFKNESEQTFARKSKKKADLQLSLVKLKSYLKINGTYPNRYRVLIWKYLLQTPNNTEAFEGLKGMGTHMMWSHLPNTRKNPKHRKLVKQLSFLSHWCVLFGHVHWLPEFVQPFIDAIPHGDGVLFEILMKIITTYCRTWFGSFPNPPPNLLQEWNQILMNCDRSLFQHCKKFNIVISHICWEMITTHLFSSTHVSYSDENIETPAHFVLWDHVITNDAQYFHLLPIAYLSLQRQYLMRLKTMADVRRYLKNPHPIHIQTLVSRCYGLKEEYHMSCVSGSSNPPCITIPSATNVGNDSKAYPIFNQFPVLKVKETHEFEVSKREFEKHNEELIQELEANLCKMMNDKSQMEMKENMLQMSYNQEMQQLKKEQEKWVKYHEQMMEKMNAKKLKSIAHMQSSIEDMMKDSIVQKKQAIFNAQTQRQEAHHTVQHGKEQLEKEAKMEELERKTGEALRHVELKRELEKQRLELQRMSLKLQKEEEMKRKLHMESEKLKEELERFKSFQHERKRLLTAADATGVVLEQSPLTSEKQSYDKTRLQLLQAMEMKEKELIARHNEVLAKYAKIDQN